MRTTKSVTDMNKSEKQHKISSTKFNPKLTPCKQGPHRSSQLTIWGL